MKAVIQQEYVSAVSRTSTRELFLAPGRLRQNDVSSGEIRIERRDRGLVWLLSPKQRLYVERPLEAGPSEPESDLHTAGFQYQPRFQWTVQQIESGRTILGRECRLTEIRGLAEYAQTTLRLWFCPAEGAPVATLLNDYVVRQINSLYQAIPQRIAAECKARPDSLLLAAEEITDPPIAPPATRRATVTSLETLPSRDDLFEIPADYRKRN